MLAASVAKCRAKPVGLGGLPFGWFSAFVVICAGFGVGAKFHDVHSIVFVVTQYPLSPFHVTSGKVIL
jgi:hypothetical protein